MLPGVRQPRAGLPVSGVCVVWGVFVGFFFPRQPQFSTLRIKAPRSEEIPLDANITVK